MITWLKPTDFKNSNGVAHGKGYISLSILKDERCFTSCWKVPFLKRIKLLITGKVWLCLEHKNQSEQMKLEYGGKNYHQPSSLTIDYPFEKTEERN